MAKEKPSNNNEEILNKLKTNLEEKERKLISVKSLELNGNNTLKKGQVIKEYGKEVGYVVKNIQTNQEGRKIVKLEIGNGGTEEYELEDQKIRDKGKNIETIWRKIGTTEGIRIGLPNNEYIDKTKEVIKKELEEDMPQIIVMENKKLQPKQKKVKEDITEKMPKIELVDKEVRIPNIGDKFFMIVDGKNKEYTITRTRIAKKNDNFLLQAKIDPKDKTEKAIEMSPEEFSQKFKDDVIFLPTTEERFQKISEFEKHENVKKKNKKVNKNEAILNKMAENADKNREELENEKEPKSIDELKKLNRDAIKADDTILKAIKNIEQKNLKEKLGKAKTNIQEKLKGKSRIDTIDIENKRLNIAQKEPEEALKEKKDLIVEKLDGKPKGEKLSKNTRNFFKETFLKQEKIKDSEERKDQARREYIEAKNQKQPFWKFGFGSKKREQEIKEKEEAYMKAKKEYVDASGKDKMDFLLEEKQKFQTEKIEKKGLSERIKNGIKGGMNLWENWDKNEKDTKFTQELKKAGKTFVKIAIIGGASVGAATALASVGATWGAIALKGGITSYVGKKAVMGTAFASAINSVPPKHRGWVSKTILVGSLGLSAYSTAGIGAIAGVAGYMGSKLIKNKSEENIKAEVTAKIEALKEKQNQKIEKESFEDFEKRQNAIEKELALIEKTANKDRFYRNAKKGALALLIGTATIEMSGAIQDYRDHHQPREYVPRDNSDPIPKPIPHPTPTPETHTLNPDAIIHKGEGIENAFIRQIEHNTEMAKSLGWNGKENLHQFAQHEAHTLAIKEGYVDTNGNEIRVNVANKVGYEIKIENGHATVYEKSLDGQLTDTAHHEGDSFEKNTEKYEYKTTGNTHLEKPIPVTEESTIHLEKPTPVLENTQANHPQELQADAPRLQFEERTEPALNLQYEHPQGDAGVMDPSSGVRNFTAYYTANHSDGPTNYQNNNVIQRNINPEHIYQNRIEHHNQVLENHHQILEQAHDLHNKNMAKIFPETDINDKYAHHIDKPVRDYLKMEESDGKTDAEKALINHIHTVRGLTDLQPKPGNLFRNPETVEKYLDRAYEEAIKQNKLEDVTLK